MQEELEVSVVTCRLGVVLPVVYCTRFVTLAMVKEDTEKALMKIQMPDVILFAM